MPGGTGPRHTVKDSKRHEAPRDEPTDKQQAGHRTDGAGYALWSKEDLLREARDVGIKGRSTMNKLELVEALEKR